MAHTGKCFVCIRGGIVKLQNGKWLQIKRWDLIIAHPPCTYLSNANTSGHSAKVTPENRIEGATIERIHGMEFFMRCLQAPCGHVVVENPVGIMNTAFRQPDQIIDPYQFAESINDSENYVTKRTCLWLRGLPNLKTNDLPKPDNEKMFGVRPNGKANNWTEAGHGSLNRSKTFSGVAKAMATQWGAYLMENLE